MADPEIHIPIGPTVTSKSELLGLLRAGWNLRGRSPGFAVFRGIEEMRPVWINAVASLERANVIRPVGEDQWLVALC